MKAIEKCAEYRNASKNTTSVVVERHRMSSPLSGSRVPSHTHPVRLLGKVRDSRHRVSAARSARIRHRQHLAARQAAAAYDVSCSGRPGRKSSTFCGHPDHRRPHCLRRNHQAPGSQRAWQGKMVFSCFSCEFHDSWHAQRSTIPTRSQRVRLGS